MLKLFPLTGAFLIMVQSVSIEGIQGHVLVRISNV